jgi:hypothetical protein
MVTVRVCMCVRTDKGARGGRRAARTAVDGERGERERAVHAADAERVNQRE